MLARHVSDFTGPSSGEFYKLYLQICCVLLCGYNHTTARLMISAYTNCDIQLQNVAPDDGLKSPKHVEHLMINKDTLQEFTHLVVLLIYTLHCDARCIKHQIFANVFTVMFRKVLLSSYTE